MRKIEQHTPDITTVPDDILLPNGSVEAGNSIAPFRNSSDTPPPFSGEFLQGVVTTLAYLPPVATIAAAVVNTHPFNLELPKLNLFGTDANAPHVVNADDEANYTAKHVSPELAGHAVLTAPCVNQEPRSTNRKRHTPCAAMTNSKLKRLVGRGASHSHDPAGVAKTNWNWCLGS